MKFEIKQNLKKVTKLKVLLTFALMILSINFADGQNTISVIKQVDFKKVIHSKSFNLLRITYGDLNGDSSEEAVILLRSQNSRTINQDKIVIYSSKNGKVVKLSEFDAGQPGEYVLSIQSLESNFKIEEKIFVLDLAILRKGEYVPTQFYTIKYRWNRYQMQEIERSCLKPLPENLREIG